MADLHDRESLIAYLGLVLGFFTKEQVVDGFRDGAPPGLLMERLSAHAGLDGAVLGLLATIADRHLAYHGGDIRASLESLPGWADFLTDVRRVIDADATLAVEVTPSGAIPPPPPPRAEEERFRILRPHAAGGLGEVSVAEDRQLNREVALKEIRSRFADDPSSRARFLLEAEITGGLEHPGIVPVYGLGTHPDGRPFYAMRFIRGDSLKEEIERFHGAAGASTPASDGSPDPVPAAIRFRQLLGRFIDVCQAIAYAHSRGVLHRDLKPGNIMLGKYGETLVVDWGLARAAGRSGGGGGGGGGGPQRDSPLVPSSASGPDLTAAGSAIGTPAYMPPEQAAGELAAFGPASDVYSLGATLYNLLTGHPPVVRPTAAETLAAVSSGDIPRPRTLHASVPPALDAICMKALARAPLARYPSAQALAEDVERYLADEPVGAFNAPLSSRIRRWGRKHPRSVAAVAATLLVGIAAASVSAVVVAGKNAELAESLIRETFARTSEAEARALAEANEQEARDQGALALATLIAVVNDVQGGLENLPGGAEVRRRLLRTSLANLESVTTRLIGDAGVQAGTSQALLDLGTLVSQFGADAAADRQAADPEAQSALVLARTCFERARDIAASLAKQQPRDQQHVRQLLKAHDGLAQAAWNMGDPSAALENFARALEFAEAGSKASPDDMMLANDVSILLERMAVVAAALGRLEETGRYLERKRDIDKRLVDRFPDEPKLRRDLAIAHRLVADWMHSMGRLGPALASSEQALGICEAIAATDPDGVRARLDLASSQESVARFLLLLGRQDESLVRSRESLSTIERVVAADPADLIAQGQLAGSCVSVAASLVAAGDIAEAIGLSERALEVRLRLAAASPADVKRQRSAAQAHSCLGSVQTIAGRFIEAEESYRRAVEILEGLAATAPGDPEVERDLSDARLSLAGARATAAAARLAAAAPDDLGVQVRFAAALRGHAEARLSEGWVTEARALLERSLSVLEPTRAADRFFAAASAEITAALGALSQIAINRGKFADARALSERRLAIAQSWNEADPTDRAACGGLAACHEQLAAIDLGESRLAAATASLREGVRWREEQVALDPDDGVAHGDLAAVLVSLGGVAHQGGDPEESITLHRRALAIREKVAAVTPGARADGLLAETCERLGYLLRVTGAIEEAATFLARATRIRSDLAEAAPDDVPSQFAQATGLGRFGDFFLRTDRAADAVERYRAAVAILDRLEAAGSLRPDGRLQLANILQMLGDALDKSGETEVAIETVLRGLQIQRELAAIRPTERQLTFDLAIGLNMLGDLSRNGGKPEEALGHYSESLALREALAAADPADAQVRRGMMYSHFSIGTALEALDRFEEARDAFLAAAAVSRRMLEEGLDAAQSAEDLELSENAVREMTEVSEGGASAEAEGTNKRMSR